MSYYSSAAVLLLRSLVPYLLPRVSGALEVEVPRRLSRGQELRATDFRAAAPSIPGSYCGWRLAFRMPWL